MLGRVAAQVLGLVVEESDRVVSKENFAVIRVSKTSCLLFSFSFHDPTDMSAFRSYYGSNDSFRSYCLSWSLDIKKVATNQFI